MRQASLRARAGLRAPVSLCRGLRTVVLCTLAVVVSVHAQTSVLTLPLLYPWAIAFDAQGNLYFAETNNHVIRKVTSAGIITTVAGKGTQGFAGDNGPANSAEFDSPAGLALDSANNLYIADTHNHSIRKVDATTGIITTVAGTHTPGFSGDKGPATSAQLDLPTALAVDLSGNVYLADTNNHRIRKVAAATGIITTVAGNGTEAFTGDGGLATAAAIDSPAGLALDAANNLYLADTHNHRIRKVAAATGTITSIVGTTSANGTPQPFAGDNGPASAATLALPRGLTVDAAGNLYLADSANQRIRRIAPNGTITTVAGQGTEAFAGDNGPAVAASLDTPHSVALSPAGLLTLADTGNGRIRQLDQLPAPGPDIHTIAGLSVPTSSALTLSGPVTVGYGSGNLTASLAASTIATGSIIFTDVFAGSSTTLGSAGLAADAASLSTSGLAAGLHVITATYPGDAGNGPAQSQVFALTVTPLAVVATPQPAAIVYGRPIPALTGTLVGVLPQDSGKVAAAFITPAAALSSAGLYPITAMLTGASAANYTVSTTPAALTIAQAPTLTSVTSSAFPTVNLQVASTTSGTPTGSVTLLDGAAPLSTLALSPYGAAAFNASALAVGSHSLSAIYSGDTNFLPSTSAVASLAVGVSSDFTLTPTGVTSQTIPAGSSATFSFSVQTQGPALSSPIALTVDGVPLGAVSSTSPPYLPPGATVNAFTLTIQTPKAALAAPPGVGPSSATGGPWLALMALPLTLISRLRSRRDVSKLRKKKSPIVRALLISAGILGFIPVAGCGNRINAGADLSAPSYTLTVTGTATSPAGTALQHSAHVILQVL